MPPPAVSSPRFSDPGRGAHTREILWSTNALRRDARGGDGRIGEASSAASTNRCVSRYLTQAGVSNTWIDLGTVGIHGNGHMMMLEKNELEIAAFMAGWLQDTVEKGIKAPATR